jgi:peptide/nickel transport system substrate-binding protein
LKRFLVALVALSTFALAGCSATLSTVPGTVVNVAETATMASLNPDVATNASAEHLADEVANLTSEGFFYLNEFGALVPNELFGTVTVDSQSPLTVTYEIAQGRKWSDGQPVDSADLVLSFAAATAPEDTNFRSRRAGTGLKFASVKSVGVRSLTLEFSQPVSDYRTSMPVFVAAHAVAAEALDGISPSSGKAAVIEAVQSGDAAKLALLADSYQSSFAPADSKFSMSALATNGAYTFSSVIKDVSVSLKARSKYKGAFPPVTETVNVKVYTDSMAALADMNADKIDIIGATETGLVKYPDLIGMVSSLSTTKATTALRNGRTADMVVFNFRETSVFSENASDDVPAAELRKAFMSIVPKARIVQEASSATQVSATDSFIYPSNSDHYAASVGANGSEKYLLQDAEKASETLKAAGINKPLDVRVVYDSSNPRSVSQFKELAVRSASAGFNLVDLSSETPTRALLRGEFDVYIGPRDLVGVPGFEPASLLADKVTKYSDSTVAKLLIDYAKATNELGQAAILRKIDAQLFETGYGIPLYQVPNLIIYRAKYGKLTVSPFGDSATWGFSSWSVSPK